MYFSFLWEAPRAFSASTNPKRSNCNERVLLTYRNYYFWRWDIHYPSRVGAFFVFLRETHFFVFIYCIPLYTWIHSFRQVLLCRNVVVGIQRKEYYQFFPFTYFHRQRRNINYFLRRLNTYYHYEAHHYSWRRHGRLAYQSA